MTKYRLRLMAKAQMTVPAPMRTDLGMKAGDELEVAIEDGRIVGAQILTPVPTELFTPELLKELENRVKRFGANRTERESTIEGLRERVSQHSDREANARKTHTQVR